MGVSVFQEAQVFPPTKILLTLQTLTKAFLDLSPMVRKGNSLSSHPAFNFFLLLLIIFRTYFTITYIKVGFFCICSVCSPPLSRP